MVGTLRRHALTVGAARRRHILKVGPKIGSLVIPRRSQDWEGGAVDGLGETLAILHQYRPLDTQRRVVIDGLRRRRGAVDG